MRSNLLNIDFIIKSLLVLLWLSLIFSINTSYVDIKISKNINFFDIVNFIRFFNPFVIFVLLIIFLYKKKIYIKNLFTFDKINSIFILFFFLGIASVIFINEINDLFFHGLKNSYLLLLAIIAIINIQILSFLKFEQFLKILFFLSVIIFFIIATSLFLSKFNVWTERVDFYSYSLFTLEEMPGLLQPYPRTTGISRMFALSFLLFLVLLLKVNLSFHYKIFFSIIIIFSGAMIWGFQSRGTILCLLSALLAFNILERHKFIIRLFQVICFLFLSIIFYELSAFSLKDNLKIKNTLIGFVINFGVNNEIVKDLYSDKDKYNEMLKEGETKNRIFTTKQTTTGRLDLWTNAIKNYNFSKILGYGPQADRFIIDKNLADFFGNNVSNAYLSLFLMGGYLILPLTLFFLLKLGLILFSYIYYNDYLIAKNKFEIYASLLFVIFFLTRSIFENSFSVFGTDFIIFLISITILEFYSKKFVLKDLFRLLKR